jgi:hypothetical protein
MEGRTTTTSGQKTGKLSFPVSSQLIKDKQDFKQNDTSSRQDGSKRFKVLYGMVKRNTQ